MSYRKHVYVVNVRSNTPVWDRRPERFDFRGVYGTLERAQDACGVPRNAWEHDGPIYLGDSEDMRYTWTVERVEVR